MAKNEKFFKMCWKRRICDVLTKSSYDRLVFTFSAKFWKNESFTRSESKIKRNVLETWNLWYSKKSSWEKFFLKRVGNVEFVMF